MTMMKSYSELIKLPTYKDRFEYLYLGGKVGSETFGSDRYLNQFFYVTEAWKEARRKAIIRDNGCDMALQGEDISASFIVHHINPITLEMILNRDPMVLDLENLITVTDSTHRGIHYGTNNLMVLERSPRSQGDTCLWKRKE